MDRFVETPVIFVPDPPEYIEIFGHRINSEGQGLAEYIEYVNGLKKANEENEELRMKLKYWIDIYTELKKSIEKIIPIKKLTGDYKSWSVYVSVLNDMERLERKYRNESKLK